jgi:hypothetical protein
MSTPYLPALRPLMAPLGARRQTTVRALRQATLSQIEQTLAPALPGDLLHKPDGGPHSRQRVFDLTRTFWGWVWQVLQANTSCREVVRQLQALLALRQEGAAAENTSAYCQARSKLPLARLQTAFSASARSAEKAAPRYHVAAWPHDQDRRRFQCPVAGYPS